MRRSAAVPLYNGRMAQLVARLPHMEKVAGSSPAATTKSMRTNDERVRLEVKNHDCGRKDIVAEGDDVVCRGCGEMWRYEATQEEHELLEAEDAVFDGSEEAIRGVIEDVVQSRPFEGGR